MNRWIALLLGGSLSLGAGGFIGWWVARQTDMEAERRLRRIESRLTLADEHARELVQVLGPFCRSFDFWFKHDMARGAFRPVRCSKSGGTRTVLFAYGFDTQRTKRAWTQEWGEHAHRRGARLITKGTWAAEVLDPRLVDQVESIMRSG